MANPPSNMSDFSHPESTFTAFYRAHPEQKDNFHSKMNETVGEFFQARPDMRAVAISGPSYLEFGQRTPTQMQAPAPIPGATVPAALNPGHAAPRPMPSTNYPPVATGYSIPTASTQGFAPTLLPRPLVATATPQSYTTPAHDVAPVVTTTAPVPISPQYTYEQAEAERDWLSVGRQWNQALTRLSMLEIQYRSAEARLIAAGVRPDPSKLLGHDSSQQK